MQGFGWNYLLLHIIKFRPVLISIFPIGTGISRYSKGSLIFNNNSVCLCSGMYFVLYNQIASNIFNSRPVIVRTMADGYVTLATTTTTTNLTLTVCLYSVSLRDIESAYMEDLAVCTIPFPDHTVSL